MNMFIVFVEDYFDYEALDKRVLLFNNKTQAEEAFASETSYAIDNIHENNPDWLITNDAENFEAYPDGEWGTSHYIVTLREVEVKDSMGGSVNVSPTL